MFRFQTMGTSFGDCLHKASQVARSFYGARVGKLRYISAVPEWGTGINYYRVEWIAIPSGGKDWYEPTPVMSTE